MALRPVVRRRLVQVLALGSLIALAIVLGSERSEAKRGFFQVGAIDEIYPQQCAPCHGIAGEGGDFGPVLADSPLSVDDRIDIITNGSSAMPAFGPTLSSDEIEELALLIDLFSIGDLYLSQCGPCHGVSGEGGVGPNLQDSTMSNAEKLAIIRDGSRAMPGYGPTLTPGQIEGLVLYVPSIATDDAGAADGGAIFGEHCVSCHGDQGAGPSLEGSTSPLADQVETIRNGQGGMPAFDSTLSEEELEAVAAFSVELQSVSGGTSQADQGATAYAENCASCHGADGEGGTGPNLRTTAVPQDDLITLVSDGQGSMPGFVDSLAPDEIQAVVIFVESLSGGEEQPTDSSASFLVFEGAALFTDNCSRCHGPDASGGVGPALKTSTLTSAEMVPVIANGRGAMPHFSEILSSADIDAVVAYVEETQEAARDGGGIAPDAALGREIYVADCSTCHGPAGEGGIGPSLANSRLTTNEIISQVVGGHPEGMPGFEGVLDAVQVQEVARYVLSIEDESTSRTGLVVAVVVAVIVLAGAVGLWYSGVGRSSATRQQ